jgi:hypothetical protein
VSIRQRSLLFEYFPSVEMLIYPAEIKRLLTPRTSYDKIDRHGISDI